MGAEGHQGGEEFEDDIRVDEVDFLPYRVGDPIRARSRGGGALEEGESEFFLGEGGGRGVPCQAASARKGVLGGGKVIQECVVNWNRVRGVW